MNAPSTCPAPRTPPDTCLSNLTSQELRAQRPDIKRRDPLLWQILEAAALLDESLQAELAKENRSLACAPGCDSCCYQAIPMSLPEGLGVYSFLRLAALPLPKHHETAANHDPNRCLFLREGRCLIYPVRPLACRRFLAFNRPCGRDEDPTLTRPHEVLHPSSKKLFDALCLTLPIYQQLGIAVPEKVTREFFNNHTYILQKFPWELA
jgi:Fe-S-cluster containining protein